MVADLKQLLEQEAQKRIAVPQPVEGASVAHRRERQRREAVVGTWGEAAEAMFAGSEVTYVRRSSTARTAPAAATSSRPWGALPHEKTNPGLLQGRFNVPVLVAPAGLEPATKRLEVHRTTQYSCGL